MSVLKNNLRLKFSVSFPVSIIHIWQRHILRLEQAGQILLDDVDVAGRGERDHYGRVA